MTLTNPQIDELLNMLALTQDEELTCGQCHKLMAEFAEHTLAGMSIPEGLQAIEAHLRICGECRQEFEALKRALGREAGPS